ncbi:NAD(P)H-dependent flavin oxidoreductase YrpB (nitropropane dioxygenase family) [Bradyrhizobium sp. JR4.1]
MLRVSGVDLVTAVCRSGVIGAFPTARGEKANPLTKPRIENHTEVALFSVGKPAQFGQAEEVASAIIKAGGDMIASQPSAGLQ